MFKKYTSNNNQIDIEIFTSFKCNQDCDYCSNKPVDADSMGDFSVLQLPYISNLITFMKSDDAFAGKDINISFMGGEPTILNSFNLMHKWVNTLNVGVKIYTNLTQISELLALDLSNTSIYATYHNGSSVIPFDAWLDNAVVLSSKCDLYLNWLCSADNIDDQLEKYEYITDRFDLNIKLTPTNQLLASDLYEKYAHHFNMNPSCDATVVYNDGSSNSGVLNSDVFKPNSTTGCVCTPFTFFVDVNGELYNCSNNIRRKPLFNVSESGKYPLMSKSMVCVHSECFCGFNNTLEFV
jgi:MoaA/NifB/PqqE/SkfB family radical SAM enzyme